MIRYFLLISLMISSLLFYGQAPKYQTYSANLLIIATKGSENHQWQNKNILVSLNYKTGDFKAIINNSDFYNKETDIRVKEDSISGNSEFQLIGTMPINQIINQKVTNQDYDVELQLINNDISLSEMLNFKMNIMHPNQGPDNYRVFRLTGTLYNDELNLQAFKGYDNEVELQLMFNAFWTGE